MTQDTDVNGVEQDANSSTGADGVFATPIPTRPDYYPSPGDFRREFKRAGPVYDTLSRSTQQLYNDVRVGRALTFEIVIRPLADMIASVIRNPEAMVWMRKLHDPDTYIVGHAVRAAVLATVLARDMGLAEAQLDRVASGALLCQIGKTKLPAKLLEKRDPSADEIARLRGYVELGVELLKTAPAVPAEIVEIVHHHQERFDGSGYPHGKSGDHIPMLARLAGLVDWYDSRTSLKPYSDSVLSATEAMDALYQHRNLLFQDQVVDEFIRALGIYPNGNLVELSSGEVALVQAQNLDHRTQPWIIVVRTAEGKAPARYRPMDLLAHNQKNDPLTIKRTLAAGELELEADEILEASGAHKRGWRRFF